MFVPTFVDLQGFHVGKKFIVKEFAALEKGTVVSHYVFASPTPWRVLTRSERSCASWLTAYHHGLRWEEDGEIPYSAMRRMVTRSVLGAKAMDDDDDYASVVVVYVKGLEKRTWLREMLEDDQRERAHIDDMDAVYEGVEPLKSMDATHTLRCARHCDTPHKRDRPHKRAARDKSCALQNIFKSTTGGREIIF